MSKPAAPARSASATPPAERTDRDEQAGSTPSSKRRLALAVAVVALGLAVVGMLAIAVTNLMR